MDIVLATRNRKKAGEMKKIIEQGTGHAVNILTLEDFPECPEVIEDGFTFEANAIKKALAVSKYTGLIAIADDSGLAVDALNGAPGIFSARYAGESADDAANCDKLLREMRDVPDVRRNARFVCCIAIVLRGSVKIFTGHVSGKIGPELRGEKGFGYDPLFYPEGHDRTFAEMSGEEKNAMSHRGRALGELQKYLKEKGLVL